MNGRDPNVLPLIALIAYLILMVGIPAYLLNRGK